MQGNEGLVFSLLVNDKHALIYGYSLIYKQTDLGDNVQLSKLLQFLACILISDMTLQAHAIRHVDIEVERS